MAKSAASKTSPTRAEPRAWRRRYLWILAGIALVAWLIRLYIGYQLLDKYPAAAHPHPTTDMGTYLQYARQILAGDYRYDQGFYYQPFYYATFLPIVMFLFGTGVGGIVFAQSVLGALTVFLAGWSAAMLFGKRAGIAAAILLALSRMHIFYTPFALLAILQGFLLILLVWLCIVAYRRRGFWLWGVAGVVAGVGNSTRGNLVLLLPLVVLLLVVALRHQRLRCTLAVAMLLVTFYLPQLPYALVNYRVHGHWVGPSSAAGVVLAIGNTPEAPPGGREPAFGAGSMAYPPTYEEWVRQERLPPEQRVTVGQNMLTWCQAEPLAWLELKGRMMLLFWNEMEIPNNVALPDRRHLDLGLLYAPILLDFLLIGSLGLTGLCFIAMRRRRHYADVFLILTVLFYSGSIVLFYVLARFRLPVVPLLACLGGYAAIRLYDTWRLYKRSQRSQPLLIAMGVGLACFIFVGWAYPIYRSSFERGIVSTVRPHGVQSRLASGWLVTDAGPFQFGGWTQYPVQRETTLTKAFSLPPDASPEASASVRLQVLSSGGMLESRVGDGSWQSHTVDPGLQTLVLPVGTVGEAAQVTIILRPRSTTDLAILIDLQRDYGRSFINGEPADGELVIELRTEESLSP